jgi:IclR family acetate operon transcriptional repressor
MTSPARRSGVQSLGRAFEILELLADADGEATVSELVARSGLPPATIHRLLRTLVDLGYVRQGRSRRYALGPRLVRLGDAASRLIGRWAEPVLAELVDRFGETANLAVLDGDHAVYVAQVPSRHSMRMFTEVGRRVPLYCTGVGKALLAQLPEQRLDALLGDHQLPSVTPATITDPTTLRRELAKIRDRGYAVDDGEQELGVRCVAAVVPGSPTPSALSVSGPQSRITGGEVANIGPVVASCGLRLGVRLR